MVSLADLKKIYILDSLTDEMLKKMQSVCQLHLFGERDVIFREGQKAENFYMLLKGKLLLEVEVSETIMISLGAIKSGYSFGWSALLSGASHTSYAICSEPCEVLSIPGRKFQDLLNEDHIMGYKIMEIVSKILKNRLERRTSQFLKVMSKHPDLQKLLGL